MGWTGCTLLQVLLMQIGQVSPDNATLRQSLSALNFEIYEDGGELWFYHSDEVWYWESEL